MRIDKLYIVLGFLLLSQPFCSQTESTDKNEIVEQRIEYIGGDNESIDYST